jgi:hypothetical protein
MLPAAGVPGHDFALAGIVGSGGFGPPMRNDGTASVIPLMHIRSDKFAFLGCRRLQRYAGATVLYFLSIDPLAGLSGGYGRMAAALCIATSRARAAFKSGHDPIRKIALNPHKLAISLQ